MADCCLIKKVATVEVYENKNEVRAYGFMAGDRNTPVMEVRFKHLWGESNLSSCKLRWIIVDDVGSLLVGEVPIQSDNTALINLPNELFTGDRRMKVQLTVASCDGERILNLQQFTDLKVINSLAPNEVVEPVYQILINQLYDETQKYLSQLDTLYTSQYGSLENLYVGARASLEEYLITADNGGNAEFLQGYSPAHFQKVENTINDLIASTKYDVGDVVEVLGYYEKGDGAGHKRKKKPVGYNGTDAVIGADGSIWGIVHNGEVNVSWFGAKGDGLADDTIFIKNALSFSKKTIMNKTYKITSTLTVDSRTLVLSGEIVATVPANITLLITGRNSYIYGGGKITSTSKTDGSIGLVADKMFYSTIKDLTIDGFTQNYVTSQTSITGDVSNSTIDNVKCINGSYGFVINTGFSNEYTTYNSCIALSNDVIGVKMMAGNVNWIGGSIEQNGIGVYMEHGENSQHSTFSGTHINHNLDYQLHAKGVYYGHNFNGCNFHDNSVRWKGILLEDCRGINIMNGNIGCDIEYRKTEGVYKVHQGFCSISNNYIIKDVAILINGRENLFVNDNYKGNDIWYNDKSKQYVYSFLNTQTQITETLTNLKFDTNEDWRLSNDNGVIACKVTGSCKFIGHIKVIYNQLSEIQKDKVTVYRKTTTNTEFIKLYETLPILTSGAPYAVFDINFIMPSGIGDVFVIRYEKLGGQSVEVFEVGSFYGFEIN